ncbi:hypothetical protein DVH24_004945 [Malus domestica]|uniref:Uncharacterized protein n=1 Tax=Malus domestica TaxID=3750 RepID=A0A498IHP7_MALDO|nr:hypothetical protein DVH24_004945 [Malus domestica]
MLIVAPALGSRCRHRDPQLMPRVHNQTPMNSNRLNASPPLTKNSLVNFVILLHFFPPSLFVPLLHPYLLAFVNGVGATQSSHKLKFEKKKKKTQFRFSNLPIRC